jgi:hypothetical protein
MRLSDSKVPAGSRIEPDSSQLDHSGGARSPQAHDVREIRLGMPEHAALLEALRREFPEIYYRSRKCVGVRRP